MTIECKDLEWEFSIGGMQSGRFQAYGVAGKYKVIRCTSSYMATFRTSDDEADWEELGDSFVSILSAQAAANEHNKQQFQSIIEEWRKG